MDSFGDQFMDGGSHREPSIENQSSRAHSGCLGLACGSLVGIVLAIGYLRIAPPIEAAGTEGIWYIIEEARTGSRS